MFSSESIFCFVSKIPTEVNEKFVAVLRVLTLFALLFSSLPPPLPYSYQGSACKFRHSESVLEAGPKATACTYFASGSCQKGSECRFLHLTAASAASYLSSLKEKDHQRSSGGLTSNGSISSSSSSSSSASPCYFFSIGKCTKGSLCPFQHVVAESALLSDPRSSLTIDFGGDISSIKRNKRERGDASMDMDEDEEEEDDDDGSKRGKNSSDAPVSSRDSSFSYAVAAPSSLSTGKVAMQTAGRGSKQQLSSISSSKNSVSIDKVGTLAEGGGGGGKGKGDGLAARPSKKFTSSSSSSTTNVDGVNEVSSSSSTPSVGSVANTRSRKSEVLSALSSTSLSKPLSGGNDKIHSKGKKQSRVRELTNFLT
jgi:hypothetical protein